MISAIPAMVSAPNVLAKVSAREVADFPAVGAAAVGFVLVLGTLISLDERDGEVERVVPL